MDHVITFASPEATTVSLVGGKAASLGRLVALGFPVPPGLVVTTAAHDAFMSQGGLQLSLHDIVAGLNYEKPSELETGAGQIRTLILNTPMPPGIAAEILAAYQTMGSSSFVAVRSSGTAEDLAGSSFAGLYDTYLDIAGGDAVLDAVKRCWASMWTTRVTAYRHQRGFDGEKELLAVVVQKMVASEVSGVMFTANPRNARTDEIVLNASWGLGEGIVQGILTPDEFTLDVATLRCKESVCGDKEKKVIRDPATGIGTVEVTTLPAEQSQMSLSVPQAQSLSRIGRDIMSAYGGLPQDIEWGFQGGAFYILQARPVTGVEFTWDEQVDGWQVAEDDPETTWTYTWSEMYWTGGISPLFYSCRAYECYLNYSRFAKLFGFKDIENVRWHKYRRATAYFNANAERSWLLQQWPGQLRDLTNIPPTWQSEFTNAPVSKWGLTKMWARVHVLESELGVAKWFKTTYDYLDNRKADADGPSVEELRRMTMPELIKTAEQRVAFVDEWYVTMWPAFFFYATGALGGLGVILRDWYDGENPSAFQELISGIPGNAAAVEAEALWELAEGIRNNPVLLELFHQNQSDAFFSALGGSEDGRAWKKLYERFIHDHGHRGHQDRDFYYFRRVEKPSLDYDALRQLLGTEDATDPKELMRRMVARRMEVTREISANLRRKPFGSLRVSIFEYVANYCVRFLKYRDDERHYLDRLTYSKKKAFLEIGRRMFEDGLIEEPDDFWFLARHELYAYISGAEPAALARAKMSARKSVFHKRNLRKEPTPTWIVNGEEADLSGSATTDEDLPEGTLKGVSTSIGKATGASRVVPQLDEVDRVQSGDILVCNSTDPGWMSVFPKIRGLVLETGGMLAHGACLSREYGIPAVQVRNAMQLINDGVLITVNGHTGMVSPAILEEIEST